MPLCTRLLGTFRYNIRYGATKSAHGDTCNTTLPTHEAQIREIAYKLLLRRDCFAEMGGKHSWNTMFGMAPCNLSVGVSVRLCCLPTRRIRTIKTLTGLLRRDYFEETCGCLWNKMLHCMSHHHISPWGMLAVRCCLPTRRIRRIKTLTGLKRHHYFAETCGNGLLNKMLNVVPSFKSMGGMLVVRCCLPPRWG